MARRIVLGILMLVAGLAHAKPDPEIILHNNSAYIGSISYLLNKQPHRLTAKSGMHVADVPSPQDKGKGYLVMEVISGKAGSSKLTCDGLAFMQLYSGVEIYLSQESGKVGCRAVVRS